MVTRAKYTYEDYLNTPEGERYELIDGELIPLPTPNMAHQEARGNLGANMYMYAKEGELGRVFFVPFDIVFSNSDVAQPDILFVSKARDRIITRDNVKGAPELLVEIISSFSVKRDWNDKRELYARHGVIEYWIADPAHRMVSVMLLRDGVLKLAKTYVEGDTIVSTALEGFSVEVGEIF